MIWIWLGGFGIFLAGVGGILWAVTRTEYLPKLALWLIQQSLPIILKRMTPEDEKAWRKLQSQNASKEEMLEWARMRLREKRLKRNSPK